MLHDTNLVTIASCTIKGDSFSETTTYAFAVLNCSFFVGRTKGYNSKYSRNQHCGPRFLIIGLVDRSLAYSLASKHLVARNAFGPYWRAMLSMQSCRAKIVYCTAFAMLARPAFLVLVGRKQNLLACVQMDLYTRSGERASSIHLLLRRIVLLHSGRTLRWRRCACRIVVLRRKHSRSYHHSHDSLTHSQ